MSTGRKTSKRSGSMIGVAGCSPIASRLASDMSRHLLERRLSSAPTKNKTGSIRLSEVQESSLETLCEMAALHGQATARIAVNEQGYMDITMITRDQWMSDGSAPLATTNGTPNTDKD